MHPLAPLPPGLKSFSLQFLDLLERWNRVHSLTALPAGAREEELVLDSTALLPWIDRLPAGARIADFGTGMGIPSLVLAALRPDLVVIAVDKTMKKLAFVRHAAGSLGLSNLEVRHGRIEELPPLGADLGTAKAVGPLPLLLGWWERHGREGAPFLALKGQGWEKEAPVPGWQLRVHPYALPTRGTRFLVEGRKPPVGFEVSG